MEKETSEIVKLTERISKDPKSKLFLPLAEEYKKAGDTEMAIHVLSEGLKNNSGYVTAKSLLGRLLLETGELEAARKELEEVVKAIPDNLLAQRKLGDVHVLQEHRTEALHHYKIALALNPGDAEFASLISEVEAGNDVRPRLQRQKIKPPRETAVKPASAAVSRQQAKAPVSAAPPVPPAAAQQAAGLAEAEQRVQTTISNPLPERAPQQEVPQTEKAPQVPEQTAVTAPAGKEQPPEQKEAAASEGGEVRKEEAEQLLAEPGQAAVSAPETEVPEEVLVVEPLEDEHPEPEGMVLMSDLEILSEKAEAGIPEVITDDQAGVQATAPGPAAEGPEPATEEKTVLPAAVETAGAEITIEPREPESERAPDQADDFTTDTLAELYIAQGFFEKAISIYERMLADKPDSKGLKDKLERVRAMAAAAAQAEESLTDAVKSVAVPGKEPEAGIFAEAKEYVPPQASEHRGEEIETPASEVQELPPVRGDEAREYVPSAGTTKKEEEVTIDAELLVEPEEPLLGTGTQGKSIEENIFAEAREYVPPPAEKEGEPRAEAAAAEKPGGIFTARPDLDAARQKPLYTDFEPREYIPPEATLRGEREEKMPMDAKQAGAARKETIERLEHWLKNIKKEL